MGFWHTGYIEFHEPSGLERTWRLTPPQYSCSQCDAIYGELELLRQHRFESHPLLRPVLMIGSREAGIGPLRLTRPLAVTDVIPKECDRCLFDGRSLPFDQLPMTLADLRVGTHQVILERRGVPATFELIFDIPSEADLNGIETEFQQLAKSRHLDTQSIEGFIRRAQAFTTGASYLDGLCSYLYGVLVKEEAPDVSLKYEDYEKKFSAASERLAAYDRSLARMVACLIEFHFNHFSESTAMAPGTRAGKVSMRYHDWLRSGRPDHQPHADWRVEELENLVVETQTDQILGWASRPLSSLAAHLPEITRRAEMATSDYDRAKLRVLQAEVLGANGRRDQAVETAKTMRNLPAFEGWAERLIKAYGDSN